ncbi:MAG: diacylglycerol kinase family lipid kinase [Paramuribaculum sp.]|nr:diacylglycerol kinase family lipid kinase [Paramuribaculum sp.]
MESKRCLLIINPISGTTNKRGLDKIVRDKLAGTDLDIEVAWTTARGDATRYAQEAVKKGYHSVIAAGGDGTVNETAKALCGSDTALGIIPCGSGNGLARHLEIPINIDGALSTIAENHVVPCDFGTANDMPFFCTFGMGFDAAVSKRFAEGKHRGFAKYIKSAFEEFRSFSSDEYIISANGKVLTEKAFVIAACNASQYGNNAYIAPQASMTDGLLDIIIIHSGNPITTALVGVDLLTGYIDRNTLIHSFRTSEATITRNAPGPAHIDGEPITLGVTTRIVCHPGKLKIYTPSVEHPFRPGITPMMSRAKEIAYNLSHLFQKK